VRPLTDALLLGRVCGLQDENGLHERQDTERLRKRVAREQDEGLGENARPYENEEQNGAKLGEERRAL
jgi:hypothetical protein